MTPNAHRSPLDQGFPRQVRLLDGHAYQRVFARPRRVPGRRFMVLYRRLDPAGPSARLGLAISKKHARRSVDRNRVKRIAREAFRISKSRLPPVDIVVLSRAGIASAGRDELRAELDRLLENLR